MSYGLDNNTGNRFTIRLIYASHWESLTCLLRTYENFHPSNTQVRITVSYLSMPICISLVSLGRFASFSLRVSLRRFFLARQPYCCLVLWGSCLRFLFGWVTVAHSLSVPNGLYYLTEASYRSRDWYRAAPYMILKDRQWITSNNDDCCIPSDCSCVVWDSVVRWSSSAFVSLSADLVVSRVLFLCLCCISCVLSYASKYVGVDIHL